METRLFEDKNHAENGENAGNHYLLLFPQYFQKFFFFRLLKLKIVL